MAEQSAIESANSKELAQAILHTLPQEKISLLFKILGAPNLDKAVLNEKLGVALESLGFPELSRFAHSSKLHGKYIYALANEDHVVVGFFQVEGRVDEGHHESYVEGAAFYVAGLERRGKWKGRLSMQNSHFASILR